MRRSIHCLIAASDARRRSHRTVSQSPSATTRATIMSRSAGHDNRSNS
jgi:hypothetical protein